MTAAEINAVTMFLVEHQNRVLPSAADVSAALNRQSGEASKSNDTSAVPLILRRCVEWLSEDSRIQYPNLFRENGPSMDVSFLSSAFASGLDPFSDAEAAKAYDVNTVATCLKRHVHDSA